jgi:V/A-type H+/Na+-transporting ATPase subunit C
LVKLSEDPKYGFAIGRVRALEPALLDRARYERFVRARTGEELGAALAETAYGKFMEGGATVVAQALETAARANFDFFSTYALDEWLLELFSVNTAFRAIKEAVKTALASGQDSASVPVQLTESLQSMDIDRTVAAAFAAYSASRNPATADTVLDRSMHQIQLQLAHASEFLSGYFAIHADIENLRTLARLKLSGGAEKATAGETAAAFLDGGRLTLASLLAALPQPWDAVLDLLAKAPPYGAGSEEFHELLEQGQAALTGRRSFVRLERIGREVELRHLRQARHATFGHEPLAAFYLLHENELRNLRLLYAAKLAGLTAEESQDLVAYVE